MPPVLRLLCILVVLMEATLAEAHLNSTGMSPVYDGLMDFLMSPEDIISVPAIALLAGLRATSHGRKGSLCSSRLLVAWGTPGGVQQLPPLMETLGCPLPSVGRYARG